MTKLNKPPKLANWFLKRILPEKDYFILDGDFEETYNDIYVEKGGLSARFWYWKQILISALPFFYHSLEKSTAMLRSYTKLSLRNIRKAKLYTAINVFGLSIAIACSILAYLYIHNEYTYDQFHDDWENIFLAKYKTKIGNRYIDVPNTPISLHSKITDNYEDVLNVTTYLSREFAVKHHNKITRENVSFVSNSFFNFFSFSIKDGYKIHNLEDLNTVIISSRIKDEYFVGANPIGEIIKIKFANYFLPYEIVGILEDAPDNSSIKMDFVISNENLRFVYIGAFDDEGKPNTKGLEAQSDSWRSSLGAFTFVKLKHNTNISLLEKQLPNIKEHYGKEIWNIGKEATAGDIVLFPFSRSHFELLYDFGSVRGNPLHSYLLGGISLLVLLLACINFMNLAIGQSIYKINEVGVRKVFGARRVQLLKQFLTESLLLSTGAFFLGIVLSIFLLPLFNSFLSKQLSINVLANLDSILHLLLLVSVVGLASGSYPAILFSRFAATVIFRKAATLSGKRFFTRSLILIQLSFSLILVLGAYTMQSQINFLVNKPLGFDGEDIFILDAGWQTKSDQFMRFRDRILKHKNIINATGATYMIYDTNINRRARFTLVRGNKKLEMLSLQIGGDFLNTYGLQLLQGRNFQAENDIYKSIIVNEKFVEMFNLKNPVGKEFTDKEFINRINQIEFEPNFVKLLTHNNPKIIGIVKDFHMESFESDIMPLFLYMHDLNDLTKFAIKTATEDQEGTLSFIEREWYTFFPEKPFLYSSLGARIGAQYEENQKWADAIGWTTVIALVIACLGLFGVTSLSASRRTKEIGVRKVLGSSISGVNFLFLKEYFGILILSIMIAWPVAYYAMDKWLSTFAYRIEIEIASFIAASSVTVAIAFIAISAQALKAALGNPVDALRFE